MKRITVFCSICLCFIGAISAQQTHFEFNTEAIISRLKTDIYTLASDPFMGREAGTQGEILARDYIVTKFKEAEINPLFGDTTYIQQFDLNQNLKCIDAGNYFEANNIRYDLYDDYAPVVYSSNDSVSAELCYVKFGITAPSINYDDYNGKTELNNKIFVIELSVPGGFKRNSEFIAFSSMSYKIEEAIKRGAKGIIFINSDKKYPYEPVLLLPGFKKYSVPIIYFYNKLETLFPSTLASTRAILKTEIKTGNSGKAYNVAGFINNNAPLTVVIGGHFDHLGFGGKNSLMPKSKLIHYGADDNASGTAAIMELARYLKNAGLKKYNYILIAFSGEEEGLLGSEYFVKSSAYKKDKINYMINLDMIGRMNPTTNKVEVWAAGSSRNWKTILKNETNTSLSFKVIKGSIRDSDHYPFYVNHIPTLFFITGLHPDYHKPSDTPDKINYAGEAEIIVYLEKLITVLESQEKVKFKKTGIFANMQATFYTIAEYFNSNTQ